MNSLWQRAASVALLIVSAAMCVFQVTYTQVMFQDILANRVAHLGFALVVSFLYLISRSERRGDRYLNLVLLLCAIAATGYVLFFFEDIMTFRSTIPLPMDLVVGCLVIVLVFTGSFLLFGKALTISAGLFVVYLVIGRYLPHPFTVAAVGFERMLMWLTLSIESEEGVYGTLLAVSASYLFVVILFGALLSALGGLRFITSVGRWVGAHLKSGPAAVALITSSLLGSVTGSTVANVTITGSFTIPMMKKAGYRPEQAGAIEAASSNGGQILPPVMGATAFVMAGFAGVRYLEIAVAAVVPALLYYFSVFLYVQLNAHKLALTSVSEPVSGKQLLLDAPLFIFPLSTLVVLLAKGYTLPFVMFWTIMMLIAVSGVSCIRKEARPTFEDIKKGILDGARIGSEMAVTCALIGMVATCVKVSGLGMKLPLLIGDISGGVLLIALLLAMLSSILLGMSVPTVVAYLLVAIGVVPALREMGVPLLQAHLFPFICATMSHLTPPVALGSMVASRLAQAEFWETTWEGMKAACVAYLLPFFIVYAPVIILRPDGGFNRSMMQIAAMLVATLSLQISLVGYCFGNINMAERSTFLTGSLLLLAAVFLGNFVFFSSGLILFAMILAWHMIRVKRDRLVH